MGCYDTINGRCPECGALVRFQSKGGRCIFTVYNVNGNVPADVAGGTRDEACPDCGAVLYVRTVTACQVEVRR